MALLGGGLWLASQFSSPSPPSPPPGGIRAGSSQRIGLPQTPHTIEAPKASSVLAKPSAREDLQPKGRSPNPRAPACNMVAEPSRQREQSWEELLRGNYEELRAPPPRVQPKHPSPPKPPFEKDKSEGFSCYAVLIFIVCIGVLMKLFQ